MPQIDADFWITETLSPVDLYQHGISRVLASCKTPFQEMYVVESPTYGRALVLDGKWQTCTGDEFLYHEPIVHLPCLLHGSPKRVLIAGGADGGALREALKWKSVEEVVVCDLDGDVVDACREHLGAIHQGAFDDSRARIVVRDAFDFIAAEQGRWDVIVADLTDPVEDGPAYKLFTREFYDACRKAMTPAGVFINQAGSASPVFDSQLARVAATIRSVFPATHLVSPYVPTYGSPWGFVIAANRPIESRPDPTAIDERLVDSLSGALRSLDGAAVLGLMQTPKYLRERLAGERRVYTLADPPQPKAGV